MLQQAIDFRDESEALYKQLEPLSDKDFKRPTLFKEWTVNQVLEHLHMWNWAADQSLNDPDAFQAFMADLMHRLPESGLRALEREWVAGKQGGKLVFHPQFPHTHTPQQAFSKSLVQHLARFLFGFP